MSTHARFDIDDRPLAGELRASRGLLVLLTIVHLLIPFGMWAGRSALAAQIAAGHPNFDALTVRESVQAALAAAVVFHLVIAVVAGALALRMPRGRRVYRRVLIVSQALSLLAGIVSWNTSPLFHFVVPVVTAAGILVIALATIPGAARRHFTAGDSAELAAA